MSREENEGEQLLLKMEELRTPQRIEDLATRKLAMVATELGDCIVIERVQPANPPASSVVAKR